MAHYEELRGGSSIQSIFVGDDGLYYTVTSDPQSLHVTSATFNMNHAAATLDLLTATNGDIWVEIEQAYVKVAPVGLTSISLQTNHATPKSIVASIVRASVTVELALTLVTTKFVLPSTKKIQGTIVGTGSAGDVILVVKWFPLTAGATLV